MQIELKAHPAGARDHVRVRHARPGRGADDERPDRRLQRRADRAGRHAREMYEHPRTEFVAGLRRRLQPATSGTAGRFTVRPEKILMVDGGARRSGEPGTVVRDVVYVGAVTRYVVDLDAGGKLVVVRQNLETSSQEALEEKGGASAFSGGRSTRTRSRREREEGFACGRASVGVVGLSLRRSRSSPAAAVAGRGGGGTSRLPTSIGKGEGALNLIEWPYYTDKSFAQEVREADRLHDQAQGRRLVEPDVRAHARGGGGGGGQYDLVSASGDASLRLIYAGDVQPVNVNLIPAGRTSCPPSSRRRTTRSTACTTASRSSGARTPCSTTRRR